MYEKSQPLQKLLLRQINKKKKKKFARLCESVRVKDRGRARAREIANGREQKLLYPGNDLATPKTTAAAKEIALRQWQQFAALSFKINWLQKMFMFISNNNNYNRQLTKKRK